MGVPEQTADGVVPVEPTADLADVRAAVRRLEAQVAGRHGVDTPAYWRAMSDRLREALADNVLTLDGQVRDATPEARRWLARVATAYHALAVPGD